MAFGDQGAPRARSGNIDPANGWRRGWAASFPVFPPRRIGEKRHRFLLGPLLHYNSYLNAYVVLMNRSCVRRAFPKKEFTWRSTRISNPAGWSGPVRIWAGSKQGYDPPEWYAQVLGTGPGETDKLAGQVARFFLAGTSTYEIVFARGGTHAITTSGSAACRVSGAAYSTHASGERGARPVSLVGCIGCACPADSRWTRRAAGSPTR